MAIIITIGLWFAVGCLVCLAAGLVIQTGARDRNK